THPHHAVLLDLLQQRVRLIGPAGPDRRDENRTSRESRDKTHLFSSFAGGNSFDLIETELECKQAFPLLGVRKNRSSLGQKSYSIRSSLCPILDHNSTWPRG